LLKQKLDMTNGRRKMFNTRKTSKKRIDFLGSNKTVSIEPAPKPSKLDVPSWYKSTKHYNNPHGQTNSILEGLKNQDQNGEYLATYKMCVPFIDALTMGYTITLPADIYVHQEINSQGISLPKLTWKADWVLVDEQSQLTIPHLPVPYGHTPLFFRWYNNWKVQTPVGYSTMFAHPTYRYDLPFTTLTGVVDTDNHVNPVVFPFFIREGFEGEIPKGTPIVQLFPFKRDEWQSDVVEEKNIYGDSMIKQAYSRWYKKTAWVKKNYS